MSGMAASMKRLETAASNVANAGTGGSVEPGGTPPYSAQTVRQTTVMDDGGNALGVKAESVPKDPDVVHAYNPDSPFANEDGIIGLPNVSLAEEAVNMKLAELTYKASIETINTANEMQDDLMRLFDEDA
ncbi:MAG: flagellar biosynthesis protein FlgC [Alphaproteobacteria bacterium]|nr:flagellar biosynthesis protein FlgC [Alphaproteobacteria bacterium]